MSVARRWDSVSVLCNSDNDFNVSSFSCAFENASLLILMLIFVRLRCSEIGNIVL